MNKKNFAFTLAETLITLGIIGIVAAMTLPGLITNYNKNLVVTRLKHQYSLYNQAKMMISQQINRTFTGEDTDESVEFYKEFYAPYIKSVSIKPKPPGVLVELNNGVGMVLWKRATSINVIDFEYLLFCPRYKDCIGLEIQNWSPEANGDGYKSFMLYAGGSLPLYHWVISSPERTRDALKELCKTKPGYCITLISYDGWKIKDDYPHIDKFRR